jgi:hypothetical protein
MQPDGSARAEVEQAFDQGFRRLFTEYLDKLEKLYNQMDEKASEQKEGLISKCTCVPRSGDIEDFHQGLNRRVGKSFAISKIE